MTTPSAVSERNVVLLVSAVQFINILDFVMVMPLGPDFASALGIPEAKLGLIAASYTAAACASGLAGAFFLERFDRRGALFATLFGLAAATGVGGLARSFGGLLGARLLAGAFGGPASSLVLSIISDAVPEERRGKAVSAVMGAFALANIVGLPVALRLSSWGSWKTPFFFVAALGLLIGAAVLRYFPPFRAHLSADKQPFALGSLLGRRQVRLSYVLTAVVMVAAFVVIPNIPAYVLRNLAFPRAHLDRLYLAGGLVTLVSVGVLGRLVDRWGSFAVGTVGSGLYLAILAAGFFQLPPASWVLPLFLGFFLSMGARTVAYNTLTSKVPRLTERATFMSLQSAVQQAATAAGAFLSSRLLWPGPQNSLAGVPRIATVSFGLTLAVPPLLWILERGLRATDPWSKAPVPEE